ncbi:MAG TPA: dienelactone hydrolase family protein [Acidimicrobiales bacterium]|jgi:carboxymethylenebutenolidase|nr:dienelactone hydrolase family protein [Acidimicrobiales bacterium]
MEHFQEYLATEVALDHVDGQLTRREALRRLGTLGLSAVAASALIAACGSDKKQTASGGGSTTTPSVPSSAANRPATTAVPTQEITYPSSNGTLMGAYASAAGPKGTVIVVHQNAGLVDNIRAIASRLAGDGYSALAVDLLSEEGGTAKVDAGDVAGALNNAGPARIRVDLHAAADELAKRTPSAKIGMVGFCFGGTVVWDFLSDGDPRLAAAAPFYGTVSDDVSFAKNKAAVFGIYGETDARVDATRETAKSALDKTNVPHQIKTYPGVGHGFYTDVGSEQSKAAYADVLDWFGRYLK